MRALRLAATAASIIILPLVGQYAVAHDDMFGMAAAQGAPAPVPIVQIIHAGRLIADTDAGISGPATLTITDGRISAIVQGLQPVPEGAQLIDMSTRTVMPGLIDLHVHLTGDPSASFGGKQSILMNGGSCLACAMRSAPCGPGSRPCAKRALPGRPDLFCDVAQKPVSFPARAFSAAGPALSIVGGHGDITGFRREVIEALPTGFTCTGPQECALRVRQASAAGSDVIKITATGGVLSQQGRGLEAHFTLEEMTSIATTAHSLGLRVMAHAHGARGIEAAPAQGSTPSITAHFWMRPQHG